MTIAIIISIFITTLYLCTILWVSFGFFRIKKKSRFDYDEVNAKKISVIIPVKDEENNIINCLNSLAQQNYNKNDFEVIIVNDNSNDNSETLIEGFIKEAKITVRLLHLKNKTGKKEALKLAIDTSLYETIASTDADCILPVDWLKNISSQFNETTSMLIGPLTFKSKSGFLASFQILDMLAIQGIEFGVLNFQKPILNNAANLSYLKQDFKEVNGFDSYETPSGDDIFLLEKFKRKDKKIKGLLRQDFVVETNHEITWKDYFNQRLRWASKSKYYTDKLLLFISVLIMFQNILTLFIYLGLILVEKYITILIILLFCKWLIDFILLFLVASFFKRKRALFYFVPVQIVYPVYMVFIWIASLTTSYEWKGRKY